VESAFIKIKVSKEGLRVLRGDIRELESLNVRARNILVEVYSDRIKLEFIRKLLNIVCNTFSDVPAYIVLEKMMKNSIFLSFRKTVMMILPETISDEILQNVCDILSAAKKGCSIKVYNLASLSLVKRIIKTMTLESLVIRGNLILSNEAFNILCKLPIKRLYLHESPMKEILYDRESKILFLAGKEIKISDLDFIQKIIGIKPINRIHIKGFPSKYYPYLMDITANNIFIETIHGRISFVAQKISEVMYEGNLNYFLKLLPLIREIIKRDLPFRIRIREKILIEYPPYLHKSVRNIDDAINLIRKLVKI